MLNQMQTLEVLQNQQMFTCIFLNGTQSRKRTQKLTFTFMKRIGYSHSTVCHRAGNQKRRLLFFTSQIQGFIVENAKLNEDAFKPFKYGFYIT